MGEDKERLQIREIIYHSDDYRKELVLRDEVLRKPLGMSLFVENLEAEKDDFHIGAFINSKIIGVLILTRQNMIDVKMRQVAVDEAFRSEKVGRKMVLYSEEYAKKCGYKNMVLNARKTALEFYEKLGYEKVSEEFLEINIPHFKMRKSIF
jgi:predicted GNAT family N-acyltransferase